MQENFYDAQAPKKDVGRNKLTRRQPACAFPALNARTGVFSAYIKMINSALSIHPRHNINLPPSMCSCMYAWRHLNNFIYRRGELYEKNCFAFLLALFFTTVQAQEPEAGKPTANSTDARQSLPYSVDRALEGFTRTANGGIMQIVAKSANDSQQIKSMQQYLRQTAEEYGKADFSSTEKFHGTDMPGLAQMKAAKAGEIKYQYKALNNGGQIVFSTEDPQLLNALHAWMDAQIKDHGSAGLSGHE